MNDDSTFELMLVGESLNIQLGEAFKEALSNNDFEHCDMLIKAYQNYKTGWLTLQNRIEMETK